jgi:hypothetical protein
MATKTKNVKKSTKETAAFDPDHFWLPLPEIAALFDLSEERCRQYVKQGIWDRREDGRLHLQTCLHMYELYLLRPSFFKDW